MPDTIFVPATPLRNYNGMNYWECSLCGVRRPNPQVHAQWHADLTAYMKAQTPLTPAAQPTLAARLGFNLDLSSLLQTLLTLPQ